MTRMTTSKTYDDLNRLTQISSQPSAPYVLPVTYNYNYNQANQRTKNTLADGSYWNYGYDFLGQVTNGCKYFPSGAPMPGQQFDYAFDTIGNRLQTWSVGNTNGTGLFQANYTNNALNQIVGRGVPPFVDVTGASLLTNTVTVNGQTAYRNQEYYRQALTVNNTNSALWTGITVTGGPTVTGNVYVPPTPEVFQYDADGNLRSDGRWTYTWDAENRLVGMTVNNSTGPQYQLSFSYDPQGRRIQKTVVSNTVPLAPITFLYDGWNLVAEVGTSGSLVRAYTWGSDLSGSQQGAGGVGGLLLVTYHSSLATTNAFVAYDGNGNVTALINALDGTLLANYDYGPFGEVIRATGPARGTNPLRFSTKYQDDESDLVYYGYRYYKPSTGTWVNRDPLDDYCGGNRYLFCANQPISAYDMMGLWGRDVHYNRTIQWATEAGIASSYAWTIGSYDNAIDVIFDPTVMNDRNWSWHFDRSASGNPADDTRLQHRTEQLLLAEEFCDWSKGNDDPYHASIHLGYGLHPLQDWVAHADFNRKLETPTLAGVGFPENRHYWHNWDAGGWLSGTQYYPDDPTLDAGGVDGRATFASGGMILGTVLSNGDKTYYTNFHPGSQRIRKTEQLTKGLFSDMKTYVTQHGRPCGDCVKAFLGGN